MHVCITYACACLRVAVHLWGGQGKAFRSGASPAVGSETQTLVLGRACTARAFRAIPQAEGVVL